MDQSPSSQTYPTTVSVDAVRVGDQVSTCGFSARLNRSQSRYHRRPDWPHAASSTASPKTDGCNGLFLLVTRQAVHSLRSRDDPAEFTLGQLHKAMPGSKLSENLPFNHEWMRTRHIDEDGCQPFSSGGVRCAVNSDGHGASIWPPAAQCIETREGQQRMTAVLGPECHHRHLRLFVRCEPGDSLSQISSCRHNRNQESIATERSNCTQVSQRSGLGSSGRHETAGLSMGSTCVTRKLGRCQPPPVFHAATSTPSCRGESGGLPHRRPLSGVAHWVNACC
jgi:hypothetical protein